MADLFSGVSAQSTPSVFNFGTHAVRIVVRDGEPWFVAADVAAALGYLTAKDAARNLSEHQKGGHILPTPGGEQRVTIINESGLYRLVLRSRKPEAEKFSDWVTGEVLPSIRKTGQYRHSQPALPVGDADRTQAAFDIASRTAAEVQRAVFAAVMAGEQDWQYGRWLLSYAIDRETPAAVKPLSYDAFVTTWGRLVKDVSTGECTRSSADLVNMATACTSRLQQRMGQEAAGAKALLSPSAAPARLERGVPHA